MELGKKNIHNIYTEKNTFSTVSSPNSFVVENCHQKHRYGNKLKKGKGHCGPEKVIFAFQTFFTLINKQKKQGNYFSASICLTKQKICFPTDSSNRSEYNVFSSPNPIRRNSISLLF